MTKEIIKLHKADLYQLKYNQCRIKLIDIEHNRSNNSLNYVVSIEFEGTIILRHSEEVEYCEELCEFIPALKRYAPDEVELRYTNTIPYTEDMTLAQIKQLDNFFGTILEELTPEDNPFNLYEHIYKLEGIFRSKSNPTKLKTNCKVIFQLGQSYNLCFKGGV